MSKQGGKYIVLEGIDGSGKSAQFELLLKKLGPSAIGVREPGGTKMAEGIRRLILDKNLVRTPRANLYLFSAARADLLDTVVAPALAKGKIVVSDRSWISTYAHQVGGEGVDDQEVLRVCKQATGPFFHPDLVIFIDTSIETCQKRMTASQKHGGNDYFDTQKIGFFKRSRAASLKILKKLPRTAIIVGDQTIDAVHESIVNELHRSFPDKFNFKA